MTVTRAATGPDLARLADLAQRDVTWTKYVSSKLRRSDSRVLVAEQDGRLAGYLYRFFRP